MPADARALAHARAVFERALDTATPPRPGTVAMLTWLAAAIHAAQAAAAEARTASPLDAHAIDGAVDLLRAISTVAGSRS
jgi:hypothetical protein